MIMDWTKGLDNQSKDDIERRFEASRTLLNRLKEICETKLKESENGTLADYDSPSWAYRAADNEGFKRALRYIILLTKEERKT